jgi:hypothetical protein
MNISFSCKNCSGAVVIAKEAYEMGVSVVCPSCKKIQTPSGNYSDVLPAVTMQASPKPAEAPKVEAVRPDFGSLLFDNEKKQRLKFLLKPGVQIVGRKDTAKPCNIMVETSDTTMSRSHFTIELIPSRSGNYECHLSDNNSVNSTVVKSGTEINVIRHGDIAILKDGDQITAGKTLLTYKTGTAKSQVQQPVENKKDAAPATEVWQF